MAESTNESSKTFCVLCWRAARDPLYLQTACELQPAGELQVATITTVVCRCHVVAPLLVLCDARLNRIARRAVDERLEEERIARGLRPPRRDRRPVVRARLAPEGAEQIKLPPAWADPRRPRVWRRRWRRLKRRVRRVLDRVGRGTAQRTNARTLGAATIRRGKEARMKTAP